MLTTTTSLTCTRSSLPMGNSRSRNEIIPTSSSSSPFSSRNSFDSDDDDDDDLPLAATFHRARRRRSSLDPNDIDQDYLPLAFEDPSSLASREGLASRSSDDTEGDEDEDEDPPTPTTAAVRVPYVSGAVCAAFNEAFMLLAVGTERGNILVFRIPPSKHAPDVQNRRENSLANDGAIDRIFEGESRPVLLFVGEWCLKNPLAGNSGPISCLSWSSDGRALAVGYTDDGFALWSVFGRLLNSTWMEGDLLRSNFKDNYISGVGQLFWGRSDHELYVLHVPPSIAEPDSETSGQIFVLPIAKASVASFHTMSNIRHSFLELDDKLLLYRGDRYDVGELLPDAHVWMTVQYPTRYVSENWPIKYSSIDGTGRYVAVAGYRGLVLYNTISERWKKFGNQQQENEFACRGGMIWYQNILIIACELIFSQKFEIRFYARENNLDNGQMLLSHSMDAEVICMSLQGISLLVYTADNVMCIYNMNRGPDGLSINLMQKLWFEGVVSVPKHVKSIEWFIPCFDDSGSETSIPRSILILMEGRLFMLHPTKETGSSSMQYDYLLLSECVEYYWISNTPVGSLRNAIWACTGNGMKIWTNILLPDEPDERDTGRESEGTVDIVNEGMERLDVSDEVQGRRWRHEEFLKRPKENVFIPLDFYPSAIIPEVGAILGIEADLSLRNMLGIAEFRVSSKRDLFLPHFIQYLLAQSLQDEAVIFTKSFQHLPYLEHALEILFYRVVEDESSRRVGIMKDAVLPRVVGFLRCFPDIFLAVVVQCARKMEVSVWEYLFGIVGKPRDLFEECIRRGQLKTAASYLMILQTMEPSAVSATDSHRLLEEALTRGDLDLCKDIARFLKMIGNELPGH